MTKSKTSFNVGIVRCSTNNMWIEVDLDTGKYYRKLYQKWSGIKLQRPSKGDHITLGIGVKDENFKGKEIQFYLILDPQTNGNAVWYPAEIKEEKLKFDLVVPLHYCIGYRQKPRTKVRGM